MTDNNTCALHVRKGSALDRKMNSVERVMSAMAEIQEQYTDGLIRRGDFVTACQVYLQKLADHDMDEAREVILSYGYTPETAGKFMYIKEQDELEE